MVFKYTMHLIISFISLIKHASIKAKIFMVSYFIWHLSIILRPSYIPASLDKKVREWYQWKVTHQEQFGFTIYERYFRLGTAVIR